MMRKRIFVLGGTGTIGRATVSALVAEGHDVVCFLRNRNAVETAELHGATLRFGDVLNVASLQNDGFRGETFDAIVSTLASRTGVTRDAWLVDYGVHSNLLKIAQNAGIPHLVLLSALCVQKPRLGFQHAKLAFEKELMASGLNFSIVRPTAFFKSLSGQVQRVKAGKPYLIFGDGRVTACKPISDADLAAYLVSCLHDTKKWNQILPIGGPGPAMTPREQGEMIFSLLGRMPVFTSVPIAFLQSIQTILSGLGYFNQKIADKAELASIGLYYARESMLVLNPSTGQYDSEATPETGRDRLEHYYERIIQNEISDDRGDHAVF